MKCLIFEKNAYLLFILFSIIKLMKSCGINNARIINGEIAPNGKWPWMVSIQGITENSGLFHTCGGSIISDEYILTAAHCVEDTIQKNIVKVGSNIALKQDEPITGEKYYEIDKVMIHPNYKPDSVESGTPNDIALIKLKKKLNFTDKISPICLPSARDIDMIIDKEVYVAGWGKTNGADENSVSNILLQAKLKVFKDCSKYFPHPTSYCALDENSKLSGICQGDSGGPLMYLNNGKWYLFGLVSFVLGNRSDACIPSLPQFHTKVPLYADFINERVTSNSPSINNAFSKNRLNLAIFLVVFNILFEF